MSSAGYGSAGEQLTQLALPRLFVCGLIFGKFFEREGLNRRLLLRGFSGFIAANCTRSDFSTPPYLLAWLRKIRLFQGRPGLDQPGITASWGLYLRINLGQPGADICRRPSHRHVFQHNPIGVPDEERIIRGVPKNVRLPPANP